MANSFDQHQNQLPFRGTKYEWVAIEFGYYAILASMLHLNQRIVQDRSTREDCLRASRQALIRLVKIQDEIYTDANFLDQYPYFLTWSALSCKMIMFSFLTSSGHCCSTLLVHFLSFSATLYFRRIWMTMHCWRKSPKGLRAFWKCIPLLLRYINFSRPSWE